jgi:hypothetical protein
MNVCRLKGVTAGRALLGSAEELVISLAESLEFLYQDRGTRENPPPPESQAKFEGPSLRERVLRIAPQPLPRPRSHHRSNPSTGAPLATRPVRP